MQKEMNTIITGIDKAVRAGVFSLDEVLNITNSIEGIAKAIQGNATGPVAAQAAPAPEAKAPAKKSK